MPHSDKIHDRSILYSETGMTTRRCFREGPSYYWEEEEKKKKKKKLREYKTGSKNGHRDQFNKFIYYGINYVFRHRVEI